MLSWLAEKMISRSMKAIRAGDLGPTLPPESFLLPGTRSTSTFPLPIFDWDGS